MDVFVARQPIFDIDQAVYGYELLYRDGIDNYYKHIDGDVATSEVLNSSFFLIGLDSLTNCRRAFINFTTNLIENEIPTIFDKQLIVIEVLEDIKLRPGVIDACRKLKEKGYTIALDDFVFEAKYLSLLDIADIIKIDFLATSRKEREQVANIALKKGIIILAEKVETREEFEEAVELGCTYFQGYFFSKPVVMSGKDLPISPANYFNILEELHTSEPDLNRIAIILERDLSLSYKLLKLINSAAFSIRGKIDSIKNAVTMLGINEFEKWINLIILKELGANKPKEIIRLSIIRAKFCELIAQELEQVEEKSKFFITGMFSLLDVLMNDKLENLLTELPITEDIKSALLKREGIFGRVFNLVLAYEKAKWNKVSQKANRLNLPEEKIADVYKKAIRWCDNILAHTA